MAKAPKAEVPKVEEVATEEVAPQVHQETPVEVKPETKPGIRKVGQFTIETF